MGTFADLRKLEDAKMPEEKIGEFKERIEILFQQGGMMEVDAVQLFGKKIALLRMAQMDDKGMCFHYNYFEDSCWESAGVSAEDPEVWSGKIGWGDFNTVVLAAYILEQLYTDGISVVREDGYFIPGWAEVAWINHLFGEHYHIKNFDPWKLFEAFHYAEEEDERSVNWGGFGKKRCGLIGTCEIWAVIKGTEKAIEMLLPIVEKEDVGYFFFKFVKQVKDELRLYQSESTLDEKTQLEHIMKAIYNYYQNNTSDTEELLEKSMMLLEMSDAPAFTVKAVAELYNQDFWELWDEIKDVAARKEKMYSNEEYSVVPVSTQKLFGLSEDDMILYWKENGNIVFSQELKEWFLDLKMQFEQIIENEAPVSKPLEYILEMMEYADENYFRIYTFSDFFEETVEHLSDRRYIALWQLYDKMLHDPELEEIGSVIFVPDEPGHEREGVHYWGEEPKRRLKTNWDLMEKEKCNNKARVTFRRYMALLANQALRKEVFGF